ncbi:MAG TPA: DUF1080 domain-containing protein [Pirellulaceae bacterium]|nr:DUF1080 domain-containing protein [Pirellulaceae bacterium]
MCDYPLRVRQFPSAVLSAACVLAFSLVLVPLLSAAEPKPEEGFTPLFNGNDLSGWVVMGDAKGWKVVDGVIHSDAGNNGQWLRSEKEYGDFVLKLEWKVSEGGNSGVFIRAKKEDAPWVTGYEIQISNPRQDEAHCTGSLYSYVPVKMRPDESAGKWHTLEITCQGSKIRVVAGGVECIDYDQATSEKTKDKPLKGFIGLQDAHAAAGNTIEYRNIRIKEL